MTLFNVPASPPDYSLEMFLAHHLTSHNLDGVHLHSAEHEIGWQSKLLLENIGCGDNGSLVAFSYLPTPFIPDESDHPLFIPFDHAHNLEI